MEFNEETLSEVENLASLFFTQKEICIITELDYNKVAILFNDHDSPLHKHYMKGFLQSEMQVRTSLIDLAKNGSNPAQEQILKIIEKSKLSNL